MMMKHMMDDEAEFRSTALVLLVTGMPMHYDVAAKLAVIEEMKKLAPFLETYLATGRFDEDDGAGGNNSA